MIKRFFLIILLFSIFTTNVIAQAGSELNTEKLEAMIAPSYVRIYTKTCAKFTSGTSYEQCLITIGDGVYISANGYILTNSQIGKHTVDDVADRMLSTQDGVMFYVTKIYPKTDGAQTLNETAALALIDQILSGDEFRVQAVENVMSTINSNEVVVDILSEVSFVEKDGGEFEFDDNLELTNSAENLEVKGVSALSDIQVKKEDNSPVVLKVETEDHPTIQIDNVEFNIESKYFKQGETAKSGSGLVTDAAARELVLLSGPTIIDTVQDFVGKLINQSESDKETDKLFLLAGDGKVSAVHGSFKVYDDFDEYYFNNEYLENLLKVAHVEIVASETDDLWRNAINAYFEDDFDAAIQLFDQIINIYPEHQSAKFYKQRAELQVVKPTTDQTDNQILLFLRQYISSDITEEQIPMILGSIIGGFVAIIFALFFIKKLFNKKDKLPKMPDPQSQIKDENDLIQNDLPQPVMQQAVMPMTSGGALPVLEETKSQPHEPVQNLNMNDKNMPVQPVEQTLSGNPSAPIVPMMGTQVMPHPEEQTPNLVEEMNQQNILNTPVNDSAPIYEQPSAVSNQQSGDSLQSTVYSPQLVQSEAMPDGRQVGSRKSEEEQIAQAPIQEAVVPVQPVVEESKPVEPSEENQWPASNNLQPIQPEEQSGVRSQQSGEEPLAQTPTMPDLNTQPVVESSTPEQVPDAIPTITPEEPVIPTATQTNNSGYRIIDDEPDEIEALVEDMEEEVGISDQPSAISSQPAVIEEGQQSTVNSQQSTVKQQSAVSNQQSEAQTTSVLEPGPVVPGVLPVIEDEATADQMPGLLKTIEEVEEPVNSQQSIVDSNEIAQPVQEQPAVSDQRSEVQPTVDSQQSTVAIEPEKVEKTLPPIPSESTVNSQQSTVQNQPKANSQQPVAGEVLTEEEQRRRDKKRERRKKWREKRKAKRGQEQSTANSQQSGSQPTADSQQSTESVQLAPEPEEVEPELPDWLKPVE